MVGEVYKTERFLPYAKEVADRVSRLLRRLWVKTVFQPRRSLQQYLKSGKTAIAVGVEHTLVNGNHETSRSQRRKSCLYGCIGGRSRYTSIYGLTYWIRLAIFDCGSSRIACIGVWLAKSRVRYSGLPKQINDHQWVTEDRGNTSREDGLRSWNRNICQKVLQNWPWFDSRSNNFTNSDGCERFNHFIRLYSFCTNNIVYDS